MHPILVDFGTYDLPWIGTTHLFLPTYGVVFALGVLVAWTWFMRLARPLGIERDKLINAGFYTVLAGILGAKVTLVLVEWRYYLNHPSEILGTLRAAGVLMGGVVAGAVVLALYCRRHRLPLLGMLDALAAPLALAQAVGRLGCFMAGCCYGVPGEGPFCVTFTDPAAAAQTGVPLNVPLVPTQPIQMASDATLAAFLGWMVHRRLRPRGTVFWTYVVLYSLARGIIEFWRGDAHRGLYFSGHVSTSQLFAAAGIVFGVAMLVRGRRRPSEAQAS